MQGDPVPNQVVVMSLLNRITAIIGVLLSGVCFAALIGEMGGIWLFTSALFQ